MPNLVRDILTWIFKKTIHGTVSGVDHIANKESPIKPELGMEEIDVEGFHAAVRANERHEEITGFFSGQATSIARPPRPKSIDGNGPAPISDRESAIRLVSGIALHNDIVLFTKEGLAENEEAPSRLIHDILNALCPKIKVVDVSSDGDMHMGLPQENGRPVLPCLYIGGKLIGDQAAVLTALDDGTLLEELKRAKVDINDAVMESLRNPNGN